MSPTVRIYGTESCPYTRKAREAYGDRAIFIDVGTDPQRLDEMLKLSGGRRQIPVIVEGKRITIGFGGS